jgi:hypothetical protein
VVWYVLELWWVCLKIRCHEIKKNPWKSHGLEHMFPF